VLIRVLLVAAAAGAVVFGIAGLRQTHRCNDAKHAAGVLIYLRSVGVRDPSQGDPASANARLVDDCRDRTDVARYATSEGTVGLTADATSLARSITRLEPRNRFGWLALALVLRQEHPAGAAAALRRAHELDPRGVPLRSGSAQPR
jgi:hypothetical protein